MADWSAEDALAVWALATFHATALVGVLLLAGHAAAALGPTLAGLSTWIGFALFLALWATTWWTTRRWYLAVRPTADGSTALRTTGWEGAKWGAANGCLFLVALLVSLVTAAGFSPLFLLFLGGFGLVVAALVGALVGAAFALLDAGFLSVVDRLTRPAP